MAEARTKDALHHTRTRALVWMAAAVTAGLVATALVARVLRDRPGDGPGVSLSKVVLADADIQRGQKLTESDLRLVDWPAGIAPEDAYASIELLIGLPAKEAIYKDDLITPRRIGSPDEANAALSLSIPETMRAMSVAVNEVVGVAGFLRPGDLVDVIAVMPPIPAAGDTQPRARIILQGIRVLAMGDQRRMLAAENGGGAGGGGGGSGPTGVSAHDLTVATLLVSPEESEGLALAADRGKVWLSLRAPLDTTPVLTAGVDHGSLVRSPAPPPREPEVQPKTIIVRSRRVRRSDDETKDAKPEVAVDVVEVFRGKTLEERKIRRAE